MYKTPQLGQLMVGSTFPLLKALSSKGCREFHVFLLKLPETGKGAHPISAKCERVSLDRPVTIL